MPARLRAVHVATTCALAASLLLVHSYASAADGNVTTAAATPSPTTPPPVSCGNAPYLDKATIERDATTRRLTLVVTGSHPGLGMTHALVPMRGDSTAGYWTIAAVECSPRFTLPMMEPYTVKLDVTNTVGTIGVEVVGRNSVMQVPVPR